MSGEIYTGGRCPDALPLTPMCPHRSSLKRPIVVGGDRTKPPRQNPPGLEIGLEFGGGGGVSRGSNVGLLSWGFVRYSSYR